MDHVTLDYRIFKEVLTKRLDDYENEVTVTVTGPASFISEFRDIISKIRVDDDDRAVDNSTGSNDDPLTSHEPEIGPGEEVKRRPSLNTLPPEVLDQITSYLHLPDLISLRQVDQRMHSIVTQFMVQRDICKISLVYSKTSKTFVHDHLIICPIDGHEIRMSLVGLNTCIGQSKNFPCTNFEFSGNLVSPDVQEFFSSVQGHKIKSLTLKDMYKMTSVSLTNILYGLAPNIQNLTFSDFRSAGELGYTEALPNLQNLKIDSMTRLKPKLASHLLTSAINLESPMDCLNEDDLEVFLKTNKTHLISSLKISRSMKYVSLIEKFATLSLPLTRLRMLTIDGTSQNSSQSPGIVSRFYGVVSKILDTNKDTISQLQLASDSLEYCQGIKWPKEMSRLSTFIFDVKSEYMMTNCYLLRPDMMTKLRNFQFLSNIQTLSLSGFVESWECSMLTENSFPFACPWPLVKHLTLEKIFPTSWFRMMPALFPNIKSLRVGPGYDLWDIRLAVNESIWKFHFLTSLQLEFVIDDWDDMAGMPNLDVQLSGFTQQTCDELATGIKNHQPADLVEVERLRIKPSILQLRGLKRLKIFFFNKRSSTIQHANPFIVADHFAFRLMPELRVCLTVIICANARESVQPLREYFKSLDSSVDYRVELSK